MTDLKLSHVALLANGERVPLLRAAALLGLLQSHLETPDLEWDALYHMRELCLGRELEPEQLQTLAREKLVTPGGDVDPVMRAVVLSAVRGEGHVLHLDSPFTDPVDRAVSDFVIARDYLSVHLPEKEYVALVREDIAEEIRGAMSLDDPPPPRAAPEEIADKLWRIAEERRRANPPDPPGATPG